MRCPCSGTWSHLRHQRGVDFCLQNVWAVAVPGSHCLHPYEVTGLSMTIATRSSTAAATVRVMELITVLIKIRPAPALRKSCVCSQSSRLLRSAHRRRCASWSRRLHLPRLRTTMSSHRGGDSTPLRSARADRREERSCETCRAARRLRCAAAPRTRRRMWDSATFTT